MVNALDLDHLQKFLSICRENKVASIDIGGMRVEFVSDEPKTAEIHEPPVEEPKHPQTFETLRAQELAKAYGVES